MNSNIESWVSAVASQLDLPAKKRAAVISELRTHLQADFSDRLRRGLSEAEATRETLAEMGESESVAGELNRIHRPEGSMERSLLAVIIMLAGYFGILSTKSMIQFFTRLADESGRRGPWWYDQTRLVTDSALGERLLFLLPLVGVAFIVGYIARKRAWRCALLPVFTFQVLFILYVLAVGLIAGVLDEILPYIHWSLAETAELVINALAILGGAHLGAQLARSTAPYRRSLFALFAGMTGTIPAGGLFYIIMSVRPAAGVWNPSGFLFLAPIVILTVLWLVLLARRVYRMYA